MESDRYQTKVLNQSYQEVTDYPLQNTSMLNMFKVLQEFSGEKYLNIWRTYNINNDDLMYSTYTVTNEDWWDSISKKKYGTEYLWWVIALYNNIVNPFEELEEGMKLRILDQTHLYEILKEIKNRS